MYNNEQIISFFFNEWLRQVGWCAVTSDCSWLYSDWLSSFMNFQNHWFN